MTEKENLKSRGWFRKILTLGRRKVPELEKPQSSLLQEMETEPGKYHQRVSDWEVHSEQARHTPEKVLEVVRKWISESSQ